MVQHDAGLRMCPRFQAGLKFLSRRRLDTGGEIAMRRKIQPLKFLSNEFLTNSSVVTQNHILLFLFLKASTVRFMGLGSLGCLGVLPSQGTVGIPGFAVYRVPYPEGLYILPRESIDAPNHGFGKPASITTNCVHRFRVSGLGHLGFRVGGTFWVSAFASNRRMS